MLKPSIFVMVAFFGSAVHAAFKINIPENLKHAKWARCQNGAWSGCGWRRHER